MIRRKSLSSALLASLFVLACTSCGGKKTLLFLNWGEYIDEDVLSEFEEKYNCTVSMDLGDSNEIFYSKVRGGTTCYDVVCPSDYMVEKMYQNDLLEKIDFSKLTMSGYNPDSSNVRAGVKSILSDMDDNLKKNLGDDYETGTIKNYCVPYLWGTWCICHTTLKDGVEEYFNTLQADADSGNPTMNQWASLFDRSALPEGTRVAMYDSHQHAYYAASRYMEKADPLAVDYGIELSNYDLGRMRTLIETMDYDAWGTDGIKKDIVAGNIDVGFMWTGDFLYYYAEQAAARTMEAYRNGDVAIEDCDEMMDILTDSTKAVYTGTKTGNTYEIGFDAYIPDDTIAFCDNLVITKDSANKDLAYKFVDFMSSYQTSRELDTDGKEMDVSTLSEDDILMPHYSNTYYVDYDATTYDVYDDLVSAKEYEFTAEDEATFKEETNSGYAEEDTTLYGLFYDYVIGAGFDKYYPREGKKGSILATFSRSYINTINATFNNARA